MEEIIDGDTIRLKDGRLIRYIGIDTPELRKKKNGKWYSSPEPFAKNASRFNQDLVEHKEIRLEFDKIKIDNYNRTLAYVYVGSRMVNAELLRAGLAKTLTILPNKKYVNLFRKLEKEAEYRKIGIWNRQE